MYFTYDNIVNEWCHFFASLEVSVHKINVNITCKLINGKGGSCCVNKCVIQKLLLEVVRCCVVI